MFKILYLQKKHKEALDVYLELLTYYDGLLTRNKFNSSLMSIHSLVTNCEDENFLLSLYEKTLELFHLYSNFSFELTIKIKLANLFFKRKDYDRLELLIPQLHEACESPDNSLYEYYKTNVYQELLPLEMNFYLKTGCTYKLKSLLECLLSKKRKGANYVIKGLTRGFSLSHTSCQTACFLIIYYLPLLECAGRLYFWDKDLESSYARFVEAFKCYCAASHERKNLILKYLIVLNSLKNSCSDLSQVLEVQPSTSSEPGIQAISQLVTFYQENDSEAFASSIKSLLPLCQDITLEHLIRALQQKMHAEALIQFSKINPCVSFDRIASMFKLTSDQVEPLLIHTINHAGPLTFKIDQMDRLFLFKADETPQEQPITRDKSVEHSSSEDETSIGSEAVSDSQSAHS